MAKRFTDTNKWDKQKFSDLSLKMKLIWIYLCDKCDHAGVWDINIKLMSFQIGEKVTLEEILDGLGDRVWLASDSKIVVATFTEFQYGELNPENRVHKSVLDRLDKLSKNKGLIRSLQGRKDKDKDKDKDNTLNARAEIFRAAALGIYARYPRKMGKSAGVKKLTSILKSGTPDRDVHFALTNFVEHLKKNKTEKEFVPYFSSWVSEWEEWKDPSHGHSEDFGAGSANDLDTLDLSQTGTHV